MFSPTVREMIEKSIEKLISQMNNVDFNPEGMSITTRVRAKSVKLGPNAKAQTTQVDTVPKELVAESRASIRVHFWAEARESDIRD